MAERTWYITIAESQTNLTKSIDEIRANIYEMTGQKLKYMDAQVVGGRRGQQVSCFL